MRAVLYVNRDEEKAGRCAELLAKGGYRLFSVGGFEVARAELARRDYAFVIYDVRVILEEGAQAFLKLKADHPHLPVVAAAPISEGAGSKPLEGGIAPQ